MVQISSLNFPSFYAECAYRDGARDVRNGNRASAAAYMRHGETEPIGTDWYNRGVLEATLGLVSA